MDYENFKENFMEDLKKGLGEKGFEDVKITTQQTEKLNESYESISVTPQNSNIGLNANLEIFFYRMEEGHDYGEVVKDVVEMFADGLEKMPQIDVPSLIDYDQMKEKLVMEVVGTEANTSLLSGVPHQEMEDLSVVYRFVLESNEEGRISTLVTNAMLDVMGVTPEQLHADALENAPKLKPAVITGINQVIAEITGADPAEMRGLSMDDEELMFVATVPDKVHGAGVIAYENFMDSAAERVGGSFYVLPSSLHEVLLVPDHGEMDLHELEDMVRTVNANEVEPEERLSDNVYHYDAQNKVFELGEKFMERQKESIIDEKVEKGSVLDDLKTKKNEAANKLKKDAVDKAVKNKGAEL